MSDRLPSCGRPSCRLDSDLFTICLTVLWASIMVGEMVMSNCAQIPARLGAFLFRSVAMFRCAFCFYGGFYFIQSKIAGTDPNFWPKRSQRLGLHPTGDQRRCSLRSAGHCR